MLHRNLIVVSLVLVTPSLLPASTVDPAGAFPAESLLLISYSGHAQAAAASEGTSVGKMADDPAIRGFYTQLRDAIDGMLRKEIGANEADLNDYRIGTKFLKALVEYPWGIGLVDAGIGEQGPFVHAAMVMKVGDKSKAFMTDVDSMLAAKGEGLQPVLIAGHSMTQIPVPAPGGMYYGLVKDHFVLAVGEDGLKKIIKCISGKADSLTTAQSLVAARKAIGGNDKTRVASMYINVSSIFEKARTTLPALAGEGEKEEIQSVFAVMDSLGLGQLKGICWESHFRERGCNNAIYLHAPGADKGIFALGDETKLEEADLALIPKSPSWASAFTFDLAGLYGGVRSAIKGMDANADQQISEGLKGIESMLGFKIKEDFLDLVGSTYVVYDAPENGGIWFTGITKILKPKDPAKLGQRIGQIVEKIGQMIGADSVKMGSTEHRGHKVEFVNVTGIPMPVAPAWTVHKDRLILALYPQMVTTAVDRLMDSDPAKDSILANSDYQAACKLLGQPGTSMSYLDTKAGFAAGYPWLLLLAQAGAAMAQGEGMQIDITSLPSQHTVAQYLFNDVSITRSDKEGTLYASYGPLPIRPMAGLPAAALIASIGMPAMMQARTSAKKVSCMHNMRSVAMAMHIYAQDHDDKFPPSLQSLIDKGHLNPQLLVCPDQHDTPAAGPDSHYVYVSDFASKVPPEGNWGQSVVLYEKHGHNGGANVAFLDGHVEFIQPYERVLQMVEATKAQVKKTG